jgi:fructose-specific phosphotransferase system IIA component
MKILDFLSPQTITVDLKEREKKKVITELVRLLNEARKIKAEDIENIVEALLERERLGSTGIGQGIAIPHVKCREVSEVVAALGISSKGVEFNALDGEPVSIIFLLLAPLESSGVHLKVLAKISRLLKDKFFRQALREAKTKEEIIKIIREEDTY